MDKKKIMPKLLDALTVYASSLIIAAAVGNFGYRILGIWAIYLSRFLVIAAVFAVAIKTHLKTRAFLKFNMPGAREFLGSGMVYGGALLLAFPLLLLVQIIVPDFAVTCFHITEAVKGHSFWYLHIILVIVITGISEAVLFDGYLYSRIKDLGTIIKVAALLGAGYALYQLDLYTLFSLFVVEFAIVYIRSRSGGMTIPISLHLLSAVLAFAVRDFANDTSELLGARMGAFSVIGMALIFVGAALPVTAIGMRLLGDFKGRPLYEKAILLFTAFIFIAVGYAMSHV